MAMSLTRAPLAPHFEPLRRPFGVAGIFMFACKFSASVCRIGVAVSLAPPSELPLGGKGGSWAGFPLASLPRALACREGGRIAGGRRLWRMKRGVLEETRTRCF